MATLLIQVRRTPGETSAIRQEGALMRLLHIAGVALSVCMGCSHAPARTEGLCVDSAPSRTLLSSKARAAIDLQGTVPQWSSLAGEHYSFNRRYVLYMADFSAAPVLYAELLFGCDGVVKRIRLNEWGTLGQ